MPKYYQLEAGTKYAGSQPAEIENLDFADDVSESIEKGEVVLDFDKLTKKEIDYLVTTYPTRTTLTDRGIHMYFKSAKKPVTGFNLLGLKAELLNRNSRPTGIVIKRNGVLREELNQGVRLPLPEELTPRRDLNDLDHSEGRNGFLFNRLVNAKKIGLNPEAIIDFSQRFIFDEPLDKEEIDGIIESIDKNGGKSTVIETAKRLIIEHNIQMYNGLYYAFVDGRFQVISKGGLQDYLLNRFVAFRVDDANSNYITEVSRLILMRAEEVKTEVFDLHLPGMKAINAITGQIVSREPDEFSPYYLDINYNKKAEPSPELISLFKNFSNTPQTEKMDKTWHDFIGKFFGLALATNPSALKKIGKTFILVGDGGNGKSTMVELIRNLLGNENVSANSLSELGRHGYQGSLLTALANIGEDLDENMVRSESMRMLKNLTTGESVSIKTMYNEGVTIRMPLAMYFTANQVNKMSDNSNGMERRIVWIEFNTKPDPHQFIYKDGGDFNSHLNTKENLEYVLAIAVKGLQSLYRQDVEDVWELPQEIDAFTKENFMENNPLSDYLEEKSIYDFLGKSVSDVRQDYADYVVAESVSRDERLSAPMLSKYIKQYYAKLGYNLTTDNNKRVYTYDATTGEYKTTVKKAYTLVEGNNLINQNKIIDHYAENRKGYRIQHADSAEDDEV